MKFDCLCSFFSNRKDVYITLEDKKLAWEILTILETLLSKHFDANDHIISPKDLLTAEDNKFTTELMRTFSNALINFQYDNGTPFARKSQEWTNGQTEKNIFVYTGARKSTSWYRLHSAYTLEKGYRDDFITIGNLFETAKTYLYPLSQGLIKKVDKRNPIYHVLQALKSSKHNGCLPYQRYSSVLEENRPDWFSGNYYGVCSVINDTPLPIESSTPLNKGALVAKEANRPSALVFSARDAKPGLLAAGICDGQIGSADSLSPTILLGKKRRTGARNGDENGTPLQVRPSPNCPTLGSLHV